MYNILCLFKDNNNKGRKNAMRKLLPAMLVALNSGACDIVVTDHPTGQAALTAYPDLVMLDFGGGDGDFQVSDEDINIGISMKKGNTALKDAINEVLATMTTDDYNTMMDEAISVQPLSE